MLVKRTSSLTGKTHFVEIPINEDEINVFNITGNLPSSLNSAEKRYLNNGITSEEWDEELTRLDEEDSSDPDKRYHR